MTPGTIIALNSVEENQVFINRHIVGRLVSSSEGNLTIRTFGVPDETITINRLARRFYSGSLPIKIHNSSEISMKSKTVVLNTDMILFGPPSLWQKIIAWMNKSKYKPFAGSGHHHYFVRKKKLRGVVFSDGFFIPFRGQWIERPLYFSKYDKPFVCKPDQKN